MRAATWMIGLSLASWLVAAVLVDRATRIEILFGMLGPLVVTVGSWLLAERTFRRAPSKLTAVMAGGFAGKMVFFAAYVAVAVLVFRLRPVPFVASFTCYFIALHLAEAVCLRRLFAHEVSSERTS